MDNPLEIKNITISGVEILTWGIKIKSEAGLIFNVPKLKKDSQEQTVAFTTLSTLPDNGMGLHKCFKFVTVDNKQGGKSRYVRIIGEPEDIVVSGMPPAPAENTYTPKPTRDFNAEAFGKCKHAYLVESYKVYFADGNAGDVGEIEKTAELWAEMSMRKLDEPKAVENPDTGDISVDNIPF